MYIPLNPLLYRKMRYAGVYLFFLFLLQNIHCGYSLEPPHLGGEAVLTCIHNLCFEQKLEKYPNFSAKHFQFLKLKNSLYIAWVSFRNEMYQLQGQVWHLGKLLPHSVR